MNDPYPTLKECYGSVLVGCGIGDTLGMPVEGFKAEQIQKYVGRITEPIDPVIVRDENGKLIETDQHGKIKFWSADFKKWEYTDDTLRSKTLAESLSIAGYNLHDLAKREIVVYHNLKRPDGSVHGGFGGTTKAGYAQLEAGISPFDSGVIGGPGNAPCMMMHALGMYMHATNTYDEGLHYAEHVGRMTHLDPRSIASGILQAHAIYSMLEGVGRTQFIDSIVDLCARIEKPVTAEFPLHEEGSLLPRLEWIKQNRNVEDSVAHEKLGSNSDVFRSYPFALFMTQKYFDNPTAGLIETVNFGGDCDTTGAIFGALLGARWGQFYPQIWEHKLQDGPYLRCLGNAIYSKRSVR